MAALLRAPRAGRPAEKPPPVGRADRLPGARPEPPSDPVLARPDGADRPSPELGPRGTNAPAPGRAPRSGAPPPRPARAFAAPNPGAPERAEPPARPAGPAADDPPVDEAPVDEAPVDEAPVDEALREGPPVRPPAGPRPAAEPAARPAPPLRRPLGSCTPLAIAMPFLTALRTSSAPPQRLRVVVKRWSRRKAADEPENVSAEQ